MQMFCYQCEETVNRKGCTIQGVCGKTSVVACLQDLLIYTVKGISYYAVKARELGIVDEDTSVFIIKSLFSTVTNVNFDSKRMELLIKEALRKRDKIKYEFIGAYKAKFGKDFKEDIPDAASFKINEDIESFLTKAQAIGILSQKDENIRSLRELIIYGLKGIAAYTDHAYILGFKEESIFRFVEEALVQTFDDALSLDELFNLVIATGEYSVKAMEILDKANTETYGHPEPTDVFAGTIEGPAILVSGHDLKDLDELLQQTQGQGVNIYTHGEMLPALSYPYFKKFKHFVGHYGTCLLYTSPSPRDLSTSRMPSSA